MMVHPETLLVRAIRAHRRWCLLNAVPCEQPSPMLSTVEDNTVILRNAYREVGRYNHEALSGRLQRITAAE